MFTQLFSDYLLAKKLVDPQKLQDALEYKQSSHMKLGVIAVEEGLMTSEQVQKVHKMQTKIDKKFGELAVKMGFLDDKNLEHLLSFQKYDYLLLGQALADKGVMCNKSFEEALNNYKLDHKLTNEQFNLLKNNDIDEVINIFCKFGHLKDRDLYRNYISLFLRNTIRILDSNVSTYYSQTLKKINQQYPWFVYQNIKGKYNLFTCLAASENVFKDDNTNNGTSECMDTINNFSKASLEEFLNLQNGLFLVNMSNSNVELDMTPQISCSHASIDCLKPVVVVPVHIFLGKFDLIITENHPEINLKKE